MGIVWSGNTNNRDVKFAAKYRFFPPDLLTPLFETQTFACYSLQHGAVEQALTHPRVTKLGHRIGSMQDTVDWGARMDVIVTADTSIVHVAGAMGKPTLVLLPWVPDWRWGVEGADSVWYPTVKLFRSKKMQAWADLVPAVLDFLYQLAKDKHMIPKTLLNVGAGHPQSGARLPAVFQTPEWREVRLDIDPANAPDVLGTMLDMSAVASESVDVIYSSHNIEHLYPNEIPQAMAEFLRVLKPDGYAVIVCPDLQAAAQMIAEGKLLDVAYTSPGGPVTPFDIVYSHRNFTGRDKPYMAHHSGYTLDTLLDTLDSHGFKMVAGKRRPAAFDLWVLGTKGEMAEERVRELAGRVLLG